MFCKKSCNSDREIWEESGHNPSYAWRSIWTSRNLLHTCLRWSIGQGDTIPIFDAPWLRDGTIIAQPTSPVLVTLVHELLLPDQKMWNKNLIRANFHDPLIDSILSTSLFYSVTTDSLMWFPNTRGIYSVKTTYHLAMHTMVDSSHLHDEGDWLLIWKLNVPARVKLLLWRACRGCLPTRMALQRKGISCFPFCVHCDNQRENTWHSFITCPQSIECWTRLNLWSDISKLLLNADGFKDMCFKLLASWDDKNRADFVMGIWSIWRKRHAMGRHKCSPSSSCVPSEHLLHRLVSSKEHHRPI